MDKNYTEYFASLKAEFGGKFFKFEDEHKLSYSHINKYKYYKVDGYYHLNFYGTEFMFFKEDGKWKIGRQEFVFVWQEGEDCKTETNQCLLNHYRKYWVECTYADFKDAHCEWKKYYKNDVDKLISEVYDKMLQSCFHPNEITREDKVVKCGVVTNIVADGEN